MRAPLGVLRLGPDAPRQRRNTSNAKARLKYGLGTT